jgi:membrane-associated phospholipid phosphatase
MITVDRFLFFGHLPNIWLQEHFYHPSYFVHARRAFSDQPYRLFAYVPGHLEWYDVAATILYLLHFVFPMLVAFALWYWKRSVFLEFMVAFLLLALAGFSTNVFFPAAPPWLASAWHYLPPMNRILHVGIGYFGGGGNYSALYVWLWNNVGWDPVAAIPSEHAAFPFLCFLYARQAWPRGGWVVLPYCAAVWLAIVYLGEHYVSDAIAGVLYAAIVYVVVRQVGIRRAAGEGRRKSERPTVDVTPAAALRQLR